MDVDESFICDSVVDDPKFRCYVCGNEFGNKNSFMKHKREFHETNVKKCEKFSNDDCSRSDVECWYRHIKSTEYIPNSQPQKSPVKQQQVFQEVSENPFPPDHQMKKMMDALDKLCSKVEIMERRFKELMN